ncbi:MAG TPA: DHHA1 domain-containing protein [Candidatus Eisenbacteria bacterium]
MTQRLYYQDSQLRSFHATVLESRPDGEGVSARLDVTAFYPGGGGQPADRGRLGGVPVLDVAEEGGAIWHRLGGALGPGASIEGELDWPRRFDHMQQHTGQHILSRAFVDLARADTRSFHMGEEIVTIDVDHPGPDADLLARVEGRANEIVWEDREVRTVVVTPERAREFPLRKAPEVEGDVRVVEVDGFDWSACGGTHVRRAGQVGLIAILGAERYKGGTRIPFVCGGRALARLRRASSLLKGLCLEFTTGEPELPRAIARLKEERGRLESRLKPLLAEALEREADALVAGAPRGPHGAVVSRHFPDRDPGEIAPLAALIATRGGVALLAAGRGSVRAHFCAPKGTIALGEIFADLCTRHGAKGGGRPESAQGAIPEDHVAAALDDATRVAMAGTEKGTRE